MSNTPVVPRSLAFVVCASDPDTLQRRLLASECLQSRQYRLAAYFNSPSAAWAFNQEMENGAEEEWLIWVHQDVFLPKGWDRRFLAAVAKAEATMSRLAVVGVYGIGTEGKRAGHLLDRGKLLREQQPLPCAASSLDEVLVAVRTSSLLLLDPGLGFNFYATDLVLAAQQKGGQAAIVDAYLEHWSATPTSGPLTRAFADRLIADAHVFETKWRHLLPLVTPCFDIREPGDVERFLQAHFSIAD